MVLRVGLAGLGVMGRNHARVLSSLAGVTLVGVADTEGDRFNATQGIPVVPDVDALLAIGLDYVVIALPTAFHEKAGLACAAAGLPTLIEKPIAADVPGATRLMQAFRERGVLGAVGHIERYNPALQQCRHRLAEGELGEVFQVATRRQGPFPARIFDVGVVKDLGTHDIDLTAWVTQQSFVSVAAQVANRSGRPYEDLVSITGLLTGGIVSNHVVNWLSPLKQRKTTVTGELGAFVVDTLTADLTYYANGLVETSWDTVSRFRGVSEGDVIRYAFAKPEPLRSEHEAFRDAVLGEPAEIVTLEEGLETVRVAQAVLDSAESGRTVRL